MVEAVDREAELWQQLEKISNDFDEEYKRVTKPIRDELSAIQATKPSPQFILMMGGSFEDVLRSALGIGPCNDPACATCNPRPEGKPN